MKLTTILTGIVVVWLAMCANAFEFGPSINMGVQGGGAEISGDGLTMFYSYPNYLWTATRSSIDSPWENHTRITDFNCAGPSISHDGLKLYFNSWGNSEDYGYSDLWCMTRADANSPWENLVNMGPLFNTIGYESGPEISYDGLTLYYSHDIQAPPVARSLWVSTRETVDSPWSNPQPLTELNTQYRDEMPSISDDGLILFFNSNRPGGYGSFDIWYSTRSSVDEPWGTPVNAGPNVNTSEGEWQPGLSLIDNKLYFTRWVGGVQFLFYADIIPEPSLSLLLVGMMALRRWKI